MVLGSPSIPLPRTVSVAVAAVAAIGVMTLAGAEWGRAIGRRTGATNRRRLSRAGALSFSPMVILAGGTALVLCEGMRSSQSDAIRTALAVGAAARSDFWSCISQWMRLAGLTPPGARR
jgi:hypothetical protein